SYNSTSKVTFELTDYVKLFKESRGIGFDINAGTAEPVDNYNSFVVTCYDYAMNLATYEIRLPDEILYAAFDFDETELNEEGTVLLNPNETLDLAAKLNIFPATSWAQTLDFKVSGNSTKGVIDIVGQTAIAKSSGMGDTATVIVTKNGSNEELTRINIHVRGPQEPGYRKYDPPMVYKADIVKYETEKAFYFLSSSERDIGLTGGSYFFGNNYNLSMYPSETVNLLCEIETYFSDCKVSLEYSSSRERIATVDGKGQIVARAKGNATISVNAQITYYDELTGKNETKPYFVGSVAITVKDPYEANGMYLSSYRGLGGEVTIPGDRGFTTIQSYAFSGYDFIDKDLSAGDIIDDEDPYYSKQWYKGENETVTKVVIPEGVTTIEAYAFANMAALEEVVLPSTLTKIGVGAFYDCGKITKINLENGQFINERAFM
ncbi:MAG: leucine-rich repeat protein, partial [Clostridiales bacterium]|nr:leucine-rich repeat protein [Clostridiales bacterium]